jgi:hypothetical protein
MTVTKIFKISKELDAQIRAEINSRPNEYRNEQNQISEAELMRRAIAFYLAQLAKKGGAKVTPLTDAQLRAYFAYLYGPDEPAPAIVDASPDALEPFPGANGSTTISTPNPDDSYADLLGGPIADLIEQSDEETDEYEPLPAA